jgi:hypothetical protein
MPDRATARRVIGRLGLSNAKLFDSRSVDLNAEARPVRNVDPAGSLYDRLLDNRHSDRVFGLIEL